MEAGCLDKKYDRWVLKIFNIKMHRYTIIWALHNNKWPTYEIDHEDHNTLNDKIDNLRDATRTQNNANRLSHNKTGFKGVSWSERDQIFKVSIGVNDKRIHLGSFDDPLEAHYAYCEAALKYFGEYANYG